MLQLRWVNDGNGNLTLEQRYRGFQVDVNSAFCGFTEWSSWGPLQVIHEADKENHDIEHELREMWDTQKIQNVRAEGNKIIIECDTFENCVDLLSILTLHGDT